MLIAAAASVASATEPPIVRPLRFVPGSTAGQVSGAVLRGERHVYGFRARQGQQATVRIAAIEDNAAIEIHAPGPTLGGQSAARAVIGVMLTKPDARRWSGRLPATGRYLIVVGSTRGNATYRLDVSIVGPRSGRRSR
jgi:hypothetical protein